MPHQLICFFSLSQKKKEVPYKYKDFPCNLPLWFFPNHKNTLTTYHSNTLCKLSNSVLFSILENHVVLELLPENWINWKEDLEGN